MIMSVKSFIHDSLTTITNEETFLQDFLRNYKKILTKCFIGTTYMVMYKPHYSVLPVPESAQKYCL